LSAQDSRAVFATTRWSLVGRAAGEQSEAARAALHELCSAYWSPVYAYARRLGHQPADAADIVQGLIASILADQRLGSVDAGRGRFRDWLRRALEFHVGHLRERAGAQKRGGGLRPLALDEAEAEGRWLRLADREADPSKLFDRAWALELLERALQAVGREYERRGRKRVFDALSPTLQLRSSSVPYAEIAAALELELGAVKESARRLRGSYRAALRRELRATVQDAREADAEYRVLLAALVP